MKEKEKVKLLRKGGRTEKKNTAQNFCSICKLRKVELEMNFLRSPFALTHSLST
jgi:hypothetical protein